MKSGAGMGVAFSTLPEGGPLEIRALWGCVEAPGGSFRLTVGALGRGAGACGVELSKELGPFDGAV